MRIKKNDLDAEKTDRFHRYKLIKWWEQETLNKAKVLVVGAGALGNEIIKNLALLGIGNLFIADFDIIENSNLSRSILYREKDNGYPKAEIAAKSAKGIYPDIKVQPFYGNVISDLGLGVYQWADIVIGGLDNREARWAINKACFRVNTPWIDGAIEELSGVARVFLPPDGPCYECTMSKKDWEILRQRRSCNLLTRDEMQKGHTPTTPTISSIIAGIQCQEAVKLLHQMSSLSGKGYYVNGLSNDPDSFSYMMEYTRKKDCDNHEIFHEDKIIDLKEGVNDCRIGYLMDKLKGSIGDDIIIDLNNDILNQMYCNSCGNKREMLCSLRSVTEKEAICSKCGQEMETDFFSSIYGDESFLEKTFGQIGVPPLDIISVRNDEDKQVYIQFMGDSKKVLGDLKGDL